MLNKMKSAFGGKKKIIAVGAGIAGLALAATLVLAAPGDPVQPPIANPEGCGGIGVAFDGTDILYTCAGVAAIFKTDLAGTDNGSVATADAAGAPVSVDAIAWDSNEGKLWGGDLDGAGSCRIWKIDMSTGVASLEFSFVDPHGGCSFSFYDGLTVDTVTDTLWLSPDVHKYIHHYTKGGVEIAADLIDFETLTSGPDLCPLTEPFPDADPVAGCNNSGLTIGLDGHLFAGTNGESKIMELLPGPPASLVGEFSTVDGRDEDLECGPEVDGLETILSREFFSGDIAVLEAPEGTCVSPVVDEPPVVECTESVNPHGAKIPPAGKSTPPGTNPNSGVNEDGYYHLGATDDSGLPVDIFVTNVSGTFTAGPYPSSTTVKITEAPGVVPFSKPMGSNNGAASNSGAAGAVTDHITLDSDPVIVGVDAAGNKTVVTTCLVPPPPK